MSVQTAKRRLSPANIEALKGERPIVSLTAYTTPIARLLDPHVDFLLVGDSVGMVLYGLDTTVGVTHFPQHFDDRELVVVRQLRVEPVRELVQGNRPVGPLHGATYQFIHRLRTRAEPARQYVTDRVEFGFRLGEIRTRQFDQQRCNRQIQRFADLQHACRRRFAAEDSFELS